MAQDNKEVKVTSVAGADDQSKVETQQPAAAAAPAPSEPEVAPADLFVTQPARQQENRVEVQERSDRMKAFKSQVDGYVEALAVNKSDMRAAEVATANLMAGFVGLTKADGKRIHESLTYLVEQIRACENGAFEEHRPFLHATGARKETKEVYVRLMTCMVTYASLRNPKLIHSKQALPYVAEVFATDAARRAFLAFFPAK